MCTFLILGKFSYDIIMFAFWFGVLPVVKASQVTTSLRMVDWINTTVHYLLSDAKRMNIACNWIVFTHLPFLNDTTSKACSAFAIVHCCRQHFPFALFLGLCTCFYISQLCWMFCMRLCYQWNMQPACLVRLSHSSSKNNNNGVRVIFRRQTHFIYQ